MLAWARRSSDDENRGSRTAETDEIRRGQERMEEAMKKLDIEENDTSDRRVLKGGGGDGGDARVDDEMCRRREEGDCRAATSFSTLPPPTSSSTKVASEGFERAGEKEKKKEDTPPPKVAPKTISEWIEQASGVLSTVKESWKSRSEALKQLQGLAPSLLETTKVVRLGHIEHIVPLLKVQLLDLRSAIIREACKAVQIMAKSMPADFASAGMVLLPTLIDQSACGNKVIARYSLAAMLDYVRSSKPAGITKMCFEYLSTSKNWKVRRSAVAIVSIFVEKYENVQDHDAVVRSILVSAQADAHAKVREEAKVCFRHFRGRFPVLAQSLLTSLDKRAAQRLGGR
eukprot:g1248.t1